MVFVEKMERQGGPIERLLPTLKAIALMALACLIAAFAGKEARAQIASGTSGSCIWEIDDDGVMTISPTNGVNGVLGSNQNGANSAWYNKRSSIRKVTVEPGVKANAYSNQLFGYLSNCVEMELSNLDMSAARNVNGMFRECTRLASIDARGWNLSSATELKVMFRDCTSLSSANLSGWNVSSATNAYEMFYGCTNLASVDLSGWVTSSMTDLTRMFSDCSSLAGIDISGWDVSSVTTATEMFYRCSSLASVDLSGWVTTSMTNPSRMFYGCSSLASIDLNGWDTSSVTTTVELFSRCSNLANVNLSGWDTSSVTNMKETFNKCSSLESLDLSGWDTSSASNMSGMFSSCDSLRSVTLGSRFSFNGGGIASASSQATLPTPPSSSGGVEYTRKWIRDDEAYGPWSPTELRDNYAAEMAGTWVWEEKPTKYTVLFLAPPEAAGAMAAQKIEAAEDGRLEKCGFYWFNHTFDHWEGDDGNDYEDEATIAANSFQAGDTLTLTATFVESENKATMEDGEFEIVLHAGEKASMKLPGGASYSVYEETPSGWKLAAKTNQAGTLEGGKTTKASFTNEYAPGTATAQLYAIKTLDGGAPPEGAFEFELHDGDGALVETATNDGSGFVRFGTLTFRSAGTFRYSVRETRGGDPGIDYDVRVVNATVTVADAGNGNLSATVAYSPETPLFENRTKPGTLRFTKEASGGSPNDEFTFRLRVSDPYGRSLDDLSVVTPSG